MTFCACASNRRTALPPPPSQPAISDSNAQSVESGFLLNSAEELDLQRRAENGDQDAAFRLSFHFLSAGDQEKAKHWQLIAARNGHPIAQYNRWFELKDRKDCASMNEALFWLEAAAKGGAEEAQGKLAGYRQAVRSCAP